MGLQFSLRSNGASVRPETDQPSVSHEELVMRVNVLAGEVARLTREISRLTAPSTTLAPPIVPPTSTVGPTPTTPADAKSGRALIRYIAHTTGRNEDGVRGALVRSPRFAPLREKAPDLCTNVPIMRWIATGDRFERIMAGAAIADLAREARA